VGQCDSGTAAAKGLRNERRRSICVASSRPVALTEEAFTALVDAGCGTCKPKRLVVSALVAQRIPLLGGEIFGEPSWG
jgi:hypothetical protein